ncbi:MAG: rRNA maturation RNase YbeY [Micrococcales bacterium]|nr:rRNA maturation RNase YbeY [Micrococcales bacterium]
MAIDVLNETTTQVDETEFMALGRFVLDAMGVHPQADLVISLIDAKAMAELHQRFLNEEGPTDVLSFPMDELRPGSGEQSGQPGVLGDVVVCPEVAARQAQELGHSATEEMLVLTVHGILHLLGFDHAEGGQHDAMFALQRKLLLAFLASR